jgi:hypothetical protein
MADPFSIIGLICTAISLTTTIAGYASGVKNAPKEVEELSRELLNLQEVFEQLADLVEDEKDSFAEVSALYNAAGDYVLKLGTLRVKLDKARDAKGSYKIFARLKWPLDATENQTMLQDLQRYTQLFQYALTVKGW